MRWVRHALARGERLRHARWLGAFGGTVRRRRLWHLSRSGVARGAAIGVCCGLLFPVAQIPVAAVLAVPARAYIPLAAASTLVTNPLTFPPIYYAAYRVGAHLTGRPPVPVTADDLVPEEHSIEGWHQVLGERVVRLGKPLVVGLAVFAMAGSVLAYLLADRVWVLVERARRRSAKA
jgi:uncharacterized protein